MSHPHAELPKRPANYVPLTPLSFLTYAARVYPAESSVIYGDVRRNWAETATRCRSLASAIRKQGLGTGDVVAVMATNTPELYEAHFGVPMAGCVLNALNYRLDAAVLAYILDHAGVKLLITDREFSDTIGAALAELAEPPVVIDIDDPAAEGGTCIGAMDYETFLSTGDPADPMHRPADEWEAIAINYTSGTTGKPKGVVYHHRGAYVNAVSNTMEWDLGMHPVYLWTLPMFHCNGWCFPWDDCGQGRGQCVPAKSLGQGYLRRDRGSRCDASLRRANRYVFCSQCVRRRTACVFPSSQVHDRRGTAPRCDIEGYAGARVRRDPRLRPDRGIRTRNGLRMAHGMER